MWVGARFVCARCRLRGPSRLCPSCKKERLDLTSEQGLAELRRAWPLCSAWERGLSFLSPRSILRNRRLLGLTLLTTLAITIAAPVMAVANQPEMRTALGVLLGAAVSLVMAPFILVFFAVFFFYYAHLLRLVMMLLMLVTAILPFGRLGLVLIAFFLRVLAGTLVPRIELDEARDLRSGREGRVAESFALQDVRDGLGWMDRSDAWLSPFEIEAAGARLRVQPGAGSIVFQTSYYRDLAAAKPSVDSAYRAMAGAPEPSTPAWAVGHGRKAAPRHRMIASSRPIRWLGGAIVGGVLTGTPESPLHLEIG